MDSTGLYCNCTRSATGNNFQDLVNSIYSSKNKKYSWLSEHPRSCRRNGRTRRCEKPSTKVVSSRLTIADPAPKGGEVVSVLLTVRENPQLYIITRRLSVQRRLQRLKERGLVFSSPKSEAGEHAVLLSPDTIKRLRGHHAVQYYERLFAGNFWQENDLIFPSTVGTPLDPRNLYRNFKSILRQAELPDIRFHDLRHTAATLMLQQGIHPMVVQERLGHTDITLTLNTCSHVLPDIQEEAVEKLDCVVASKQ